MDNGSGERTLHSGKVQGQGKVNRVETSFQLSSKLHLTRTMLI